MSVWKKRGRRRKRNERRRARGIMLYLKVAGGGRGGWGQKRKKKRTISRCESFMARYRIKDFIYISRSFFFLCSFFIFVCFFGFFVCINPSRCTRGPPPLWENKLCGSIVVYFRLILFLLFPFVSQTDHHVPGVRHERGKRLWFDVSEVPPGEHIIGAELRLYRSMEMKHRRNRGSSFTVTAYRVLRTEDGWAPIY